MHRTNVLPDVRGLRVVRKPDWNFGSTDGGEGFVGTVSHVQQPCAAHNGKALVAVYWDMGNIIHYQNTEDNLFDLLVWDSGPIGIKHSTSVCRCCKEVIIGLRFTCLACVSAFGSMHLCSRCYNEELDIKLHNHNPSHQFHRFDSPTAVPVQLDVRDHSSRKDAKGIFVNAIVRPGRWVKSLWFTDDNHGEVIAIKGCDAGLTARGIARVRWNTGRVCDCCVGYNRRNDVTLVRGSEASGGHYFPDHLPRLGEGIYAVITTLANTNVNLNPALPSTSAVVFAPSVSARRPRAAASEDLCLFCTEELARLRFEPCQHIVTCVECGKNKKICPMKTCRRDIERKINLITGLPLVVNITPQEESARLREQINSLKEESLCRICSVRQIERVFNCGHSSCAECLKKLKICPTCHKRVMHTVPFYP